MHNFLELNRLTFGPRVEERARFQEIGLAAWVEEQLSYESINDFDCELLLQPFKTLDMDANELEGISNGLFEDYDRLSVPNELSQATLMRQVYSRRQLYNSGSNFGVTTLILYEKGNCFYLKTVDGVRIRRHALVSPTVLASPFTFHAVYPKSA